MNETERCMEGVVEAEGDSRKFKRSFGRLSEKNGQSA